MRQNEHPLGERDEEREALTILSGRNPIREALKSDTVMDKLLVQEGELSGSARQIVAQAREKGIIVQTVNKRKLDAMSPMHQGMVAVLPAHAYASVEDMLALAKERGEAPLLVALDGVSDPHNLGAVIRTAEVAGAHGVIIPERRAAGLTPIAVKASSGAALYLPVARVRNITDTLEELKKRGLWIYGADMEGESYAAQDYSSPMVLVLGAEGSGLSPRVGKSCDKRIAVPVRGRVDSLNVSVAAGVILFKIVELRG